MTLPRIESPWHEELNLATIATRQVLTNQTLLTLGVANIDKVTYKIFEAHVNFLKHTDTHLKY